MDNQIPLGNWHLLLRGFVRQALFGVEAFASVAGHLFSAESQSLMSAYDAWLARAVKQRRTRRIHPQGPIVLKMTRKLGEEPGNDQPLPPGGNHRVPGGVVLPTFMSIAQSPSRRKGVLQRREQRTAVQTRCRRRDDDWNVEGSRGTRQCHDIVEPDLPRRGFHTVSEPRLKIDK